MEKDEIMTMFGKLIEEGKEASSESFSPDDSDVVLGGNLELMDDKSLRKVCAELIDQNKKSKTMIRSLVSDTICLKKKVKELQEEAESTKSQIDILKSDLHKQDKLLNAVIEKMEENKKKSEEYAGKIEQNQKVLESSIKKSEEHVEQKYNEVVKMSKGVQEDKSKMSKMSSEVEAAVTNVKVIVKDEIKENANLIREECERANSVIISGISEPEIESIVKRQDYIRKVVHKIFDSIKDPEDKWMEEVMEVRRVGRYDPNKKELNKRPIRVRFTSERIAREVIAMAKKLRKLDGMKEVYINKDLSLPERIKIQEQRVKAREQNENRTDEEAKKYFFAVRRGRVMRLFKRRETEEEEGAIGGAMPPRE